MSNTYGSSQYGLNTYGTATELSKEELEKYFVDLYKYVPDFIQEIPETNAIYKVEGLELGTLAYQMEDVKNQFRIDTATWGLSLWEEKYGITTNLSLSYEERREIVKARKRGRGTTTIKMIQNVAESFSGGTVQIIPHNEEYYFVVKFIGVKGIPKNMDAFIETLEIIKPAHLGYVFEYTYLTWDQFDAYNFTADQLDTITWDELEVM